MEPTLIDLGDVPVNQDTLFESDILNDTTSEQQVNIQFSCNACTFLETSIDRIAPNASVTLTFRFHPTATGSVIKSIFPKIGNVDKTILFKANVI